nr:MAG TPA: hypothetical protein [Caudoviricetes sp.]
MRPGPRKAPEVTPRQPGPDPQEGCGTWGSLRQNKNPADMPGLCLSRIFFFYTPSIRQAQNPAKNPDIRRLRADKSQTTNPRG